MSERSKLVLLSCVEYVYLVLLWMAFVSKTDLTELKVGLGVALAGTIADALVKAEGSGHFRPHLRWTLLSLLEPWYVLKGMRTLIEELPRALAGKGDGHFKAVQFDAGEEDVEAASRRAVATMLLTIPPNSVVVGIDGHNGKMLVHEMKPEKPTLIARELGVQE